MLEKYLFVFFVAMVPVIELRGAIPIGLGLGLDVLPTYIVAVVGNMVPVPVIYLFARKFLIWGYHKPLIGGICKFFVVKGEKAGRALEAKAGRGLVAALLIFVGIPLPGTGAWTGTLAGSILDMKFKDVLVACMGGRAAGRRHHRSGQRRAAGRIQRAVCGIKSPLRHSPLARPVPPPPQGEARTRPWVSGGRG